MPSDAQISANQLNSQHSTGPITPEGKARSARNALKLGLFAVHGFVRPEEEPEYQAICAGLWSDLLPQGALQESLAVEVVRATWRLQRCARVESGLLDRLLETGLDPMQDESTRKTQTAVDRARTQSHTVVRRAIAELRRLQTERQIARELRDDASAQGDDEAPQTPGPGLASRKGIAAAVAAQNKVNGQNEPELNINLSRLLIDTIRQVGPKRVDH